MPSRSFARSIVVVYTEWAPYTYTQGGHPAGFEVDICRAVFASMGVTAQFQGYPWNRCLALLKSGGADALVSLLKTAEREEFAHYPAENVSVSRTVFAVRAGSAIAYSGDLRDLAAHPIGVISGFSYGEAFDKADSLTKDVATNTQEMLTKLVMGRTDLAAENQAVLASTAYWMGLRGKISFLEPPIHEQMLYVGFTKAKDTARLCEEFSGALARFKQTAAYEAILGAYGVE
jgi:polar amino acid transport system substrate-binding protein